MTKKIIIVGGGIGGVTAALALHNAGFYPEIYEAREKSETNTGLFLNLAANGIEILKSLGLDEAITAEGSPAPRMIITNAAGKELGEVRNGARDGLTESIIMRRGALQHVLYDTASAQNIPIYFGKKLAKISQDTPNCIIAHFDDSTTVEGDLLIGSDGIHSHVRQIINADAAKPEFSGLVSTGGFTSQIKLKPTENTQYFVFGKRAFFGYHVPASGEVYWFNNHGYEHEPQRNEFTKISHEEWQKRLIAMHSDDMPLIRDIIESTESGISAYPIYDIPTQPLWYKGRIVLIGDAIHAISPSSGQGASLAIEDAVILAKCLRDTASHNDAFTAYEQIRRERVEAVVKWGRTFGGAKLMTNPIQVWFRDHMMPFFLKFAAKPDALDWVYGYAIDWQKPVEYDLATPTSNH